MKTAQEVYDDAYRQLELWIKGGCLSRFNTKGKYTTGFGDPGKPNESIAQDDYNTLSLNWTSLNTKRMKVTKPATNPTPAVKTMEAMPNFRCAASASLREQNGWDLLAEFGDATYGFVYHILVVK